MVFESYQYDLIEDNPCPKDADSSPSPSALYLKSIGN